MASGTNKVGGMQLLWLTDLHLDRALNADRHLFLGSLRSSRFDAAVVTGTYRPHGSSAGISWIWAAPAIPNRYILFSEIMIFSGIICRCRCVGCRCLPSTVQFEASGEWRNY